MRSRKVKLNGVFIAGEVDLTMGMIASLIISNAMHTFNDCCLGKTKEELFDQLKRMFDTNIAKTPIHKYKSKSFASGHFKFLTYGSIRFDKSFPWEVSNNNGRCY